MRHAGDAEKLALQFQILPRGEALSGRDGEPRPELLGVAVHVVPLPRLDRRGRVADALVAWAHILASEPTRTAKAHPGEGFKAEPPESRREFSAALAIRECVRRMEEDGKLGYAQYPYLLAQLRPLLDAGDGIFADQSGVPAIAEENADGLAVIVVGRGHGELLIVEPSCNLFRRHLYWSEVAEDLKEESQLVLVMGFRSCRERASRYALSKALEEALGVLRARCFAQNDAGGEQMRAPTRHDLMPRGAGDGGLESGPVIDLAARERAEGAFALGVAQSLRFAITICRRGEEQRTHAAFSPLGGLVPSLLGPLDAEGIRPADAVAQNADAAGGRSLVRVFSRPAIAFGSRLHVSSSATESQLVTSFSSERPSLTPKPKSDGGANRDATCGATGQRFAFGTGGAA